MKIKAKLTETQAKILYNILLHGTSSTYPLWRVFGRRLVNILGEAEVLFNPEPASILKEADWVNLCHILDLSSASKAKLSGLPVSCEDSTALYDAIAEPVAKVLVDRGCADSLVIEIESYSHG